MRHLEVASPVPVVCGRANRRATHIAEPAVRLAAEQHARVGLEVAERPDGSRRARARVVGQHHEVDGRRAAIRSAMACASTPAAAVTGTNSTSTTGLCRVQAEDAGHPERQRAAMRDAERRRRLDAAVDRRVPAETRCPRSAAKHSTWPRGTTSWHCARRRRERHRRVRAPAPPARIDVPVDRGRMRARRPRTRSATTSRSPRKRQDVPPVLDRRVAVVRRLRSSRRRRGCATAGRGCSRSSSSS